MILHTLHRQHSLISLISMSSKPKPTDKAASLLAAIQRTPLSAAEPAEAQPPSPQPEPPTQSVPPAPAARPKAHPAKHVKSRVGKPVQFWLHDEDRKLVRELSAWLAGQGERPTDSLVIRSALRVANAGGELLKAYRQASQLDGRLKQHKKSHEAMHTE
jgi:hypothetical protein